MKPSDEQRDEAYRKITDEKVKDLYRAPESGDTLYAIFKKNNLAEAKYRTYAEIIGDVILGLKPKTNLTESFRSGLEISQENAVSLSNDLDDFLSPLQDRDDTVIADNTVTPLRTMEGDIEKIHGYGAHYVTPEPDDEIVHTSSQTETLQKEPLADLPTYNNTETKPAAEPEPRDTRWDKQ